MEWWKERMQAIDPNRHYVPAQTARSLVCLALAHLAGSI